MTDISSLKAEEKHVSRTPAGPEDARLAGGRGPCSGRLEVKHQREWRALTSRGREARAHANVRYALVVCRHIGCGSVVSIEHNSNNTDSQPAWEVNFSCSGPESSLQECGSTSARKRIHGKESWTSSLDVICSESVRLVGAADRCQGSVEVRWDQGWASVCEEGFQVEAQKVLCRELGCGPPGSFSGSFKKGEGLVSSKQFQCKGNESHLGDCASSTRNNCRTVAGISCRTLIARPFSQHRSPAPIASTDRQAFLSALIASTDRQAFLSALIASTDRQAFLSALIASTDRQAFLSALIASTDRQAFLSALIASTDRQAFLSALIASTDRQH
ncbi:hypothetical protein NQZ68_037035 [Dissostichus eleginoides]|nr:hypothetical protein NQZ68_037035 [Dissostichus eleginoides]